MKRVTLIGINRVGLANWKGREWWARQTVCIWSCEHQAWWRANYSGYTDREAQAGLYSFGDAYDATKHCGPEKKIVYYAIPLPAMHERREVT